MWELMDKLHALFGRRYRVIIQRALPFMPYAAVAYLLPKSGPGESAPVAVLPLGASPAEADE